MCKRLIRHVSRTQQDMTKQNKASLPRRAWQGCLFFIYARKPFAHAKHMPAHAKHTSLSRSLRLGRRERDSDDVLGGRCCLACKQFVTSPAPSDIYKIKTRHPCHAGRGRGCLFCFVMSCYARRDVCRLHMPNTCLPRQAHITVPFSSTWSEWQGMCLACLA